MRLQRGKAATLPAELVAALTALFGDRAQDVRVIEHSWFARAHFGAVATTRRRRIYLRGSAADFVADLPLVLHEYCHVVHQWETGRLTTVGYVLESIRRGYCRNRFEVEARSCARANLALFTRLLTAQHAPRLDQT